MDRRWQTVYDERRNSWTESKRTGERIGLARRSTVDALAHFDYSFNNGCAALIALRNRHY